MKRTHQQHTKPTNQNLLKDISKLHKAIFALFIVTAMAFTAAYAFEISPDVLAKKLFGQAVKAAPKVQRAEPKSETPKPDGKKQPNLAAAALSSGTLTVARSGHTATQLDAGTILIAGGDSGTFEIYDPSLNTSSGYGSLTTARTRHTATKLSDSRVLITGGTDANGAALSSTEIYDPSTNSFSAGATMNAGRAGHTATVLPDGRILIAGGDADGSAEIFDAASGAFTSLANAMTTPRSGHSAVLMNDGRVFIAGGEELASAEIFNSADSTFTATGNEMAHHRANATLRVLPDGKVQIIGGNDDTSMEVYDPAIDTIGAHDHLIPTNDEHDALMRFDILNAPTRAALFHHGQTDTLIDRENHSITELGNQALVAGGTNTAGQTLNTLSVLDSSSATVTTNKLDYVPGETAVISGTGWQAGEVVDIILHEDPHTHTERRLTATADANGNFTANYLVESHDLGVTFIAGVKGQTSGRTAQTTFTDARTWTYTVSPSSTTIGTLTTFTLTVTNTGGNCGVNNDAMGSFETTIPSAFTLGTPTITAPTGKSWSVSKTGQLIRANASSGVGGDKLCPTESIIITIPATATTAIGSPFTWIGNAYNSLSWTAASIFNAPTGGQPIVTVSACSAPSISANPASATKNVGESMTFSVTASGTAPLSYQWRKGGVDISGATSSSYMIPSVVTGDAGSYDVVVTNACGSATSTAATLTVNKLNQTITFGALGDKIYGDADFNVSATASSGLTVSFAASGNCTVTGTLVHITGAGSCTITASQAGDATYNAAPDVMQSFNIAKATPTATLQVNNSPATYDGTAKSATVGITASSVPGSVANIQTGGAASQINAGTYAVTADFVPTDTANYNTLTGLSAGSFVINKANAVISVTPYSVTYDGNPHTATGTAVGVESPSPANLNSLLDLSGTTHTNAGDYTADAWTFAGNANYNAANGTVHDVINKATPTITWVNPSDITYGTALSATQLNATANVAGSNFVYTPASGTVLNAGNVQNLHVDFTPDDTANYNNASKDVSINVLKAATTIVLTCPANITYTGAALEPCTATVTGAGGLNESVAVIYSNNVNAGTATASASFAETANHLGSSTSNNFTIDKAASVTTLICPTNVTFTGAALTPCSASVTGAGGLNESVTVNYTNNTNAGTATASAAYSESANHLGSSDSENFTIDKAATVTTVSCPTNATYTGTAIEICTAVVTGANLNEPLTVSYSNNINAGTATANASYAESANHLGSSSSANFTIDKAATTTTITCPTNVIYTGAAQEPCSATVSGANLNEPVAVTYTNNVNAGTATANAAYSESANHLGSSDTENFTIDKASSTTVVTCPTNVTYTGAAIEPCTVAITGAGGLNLTPTPTYVNNVNAGTATASFTFAGDDNHNGSGDSKNFTIDKAATITMVTCPTNVTYTGAAQEPCSASVTGANLNEILTVSYTNNTNAGTASASASYAENVNYLGSSDSENFTIDKAATTTTVNCPTNATYTGAAIEPCTAAVTGANLNEPVAVSYTSNVNAGTATATAAYAENANYLGSSDTKNFTIDKAATTTAVSCPPNVTYTGSALDPCTATVTGANLSQALIVSYTDNVNAGTATASASYAESANYLGSSDTENFVIDKAATTTVVVCPPNITYTGAAQEPCSATVSGANLSQPLTVSYLNNTNAGSASASAAFAETANHLGSSDSETFTIDRAATTTTVVCPPNVTYTGAAIEPCSASVSGAGGLNEVLTVSYTNNVNAGTASASASYAETSNHLGSSDSENFTIDRAATTTTVICPANVTYTGAAQTPCSASVSGANLSATLTVSYTTNTDAGTATVSASYVESANHLGSSDTENFTIDKAATTTVITCPTNVTFTGSALTPCTATVTGANLSAAVAVTYTDNTNAGTATASATYSESANHLGSSDTETFTIDKAVSTTTVTCPATVTFTGSALTPCTAAATGVGGLNQSLTVSYTNNVNAGTATASASYAGDANHIGSSGSTNFTIAKASSTTTVVCPASVVYPGTASTPCTASVSGAGGLNQTLTVVYSNNTSVGTATASASYAGDSNHTSSSDSKTFMITARAALVNYIGQTSWVTSGTSSTTAQVTLTASVQDPTGTALSGAKMDFIDATSNRVLASGVTVSPVAGSTANTGTANTIVTLSTGQYGAESYVILVRMSGNYTNAAQPMTDKTATVVVSKPAATNEAIGGGKINGLASAAGTYRSNVGAQISWTVGMTYNKSGTNPQGKITITIPQPDGSVFYVKSNSISSMAITNVTNVGKKGTIYTKSSITKILPNGTPITIQGNVSLRMDITDYTLATTTDEVGYTVLSSSNSELFYSNNWLLDSTNAWRTVPQAIAMGTVKIN